MPIEQPHPPDPLLLQYADGELSGPRVVQIRRHLAACWDCRSRMSALESAISNLIQARHQSLDSKISPIDGPRALLKARLAAEAIEPHRASWWQFRDAFRVRTLAYAAALAIVIFLAARAAYLRPRYDQPVISHYDAMLPDRNLTPGAARPVSVADLCTATHDEVIRPVPATVQQAVFTEYGIRGVPAGNYEVDHLITPGLGGTDEIRNLWPEPRYDTAWNSFVKDDLEDYLHLRVCRGDLNLKAAQRDVSTDWIWAYKKYFHTEVPLVHVTWVDLPVARNHAALAGSTFDPRRFALDFQLGL
jgi:hypothetical protein